MKKIAFLLKFGLLIALFIMQIQSSYGADFKHIKNKQNYLGSEIWDFEFASMPSVSLSYDFELNSIELTVVNTKTTPIKNQITYKNLNIQYIKLVKRIGSNIVYSIKLAPKINVNYSTNGNRLVLYTYKSSQKFIRPLRISIDPGHGGKDPGAIGKVYKTYEKNVTLQVAKNLYALLNQDPFFIPSLTRTNDTYVGVIDRTDISRKNKADIMLSLHADSSLNVNAAGGSIWILSNRRATTETGRLIEDSERKSSLIGGVSQVLSKTSGIEHTILDLQFSHSQRLSTDLAESVLGGLKGVINLHKNSIQYASLGVLRNPDIPSILVEMGFLSNRYEESVLRNSKYQAQIANAIYAGLINYRNDHMNLYGLDAKVIVNHTNLPRQAIASGKGATPTYADSGVTYVIAKGDNINKIAAKYNISSQTLLDFNKISNANKIFSGQKLKIPTISSILPKVNNPDHNSQLINTGNTYKIEKGDSLSKIALSYQLTIKQLMDFNKIKYPDAIKAGQIIKIPSTKEEIVENYKPTDVTRETRLVDQGLIYTIKSGDTITKIAQKYKLAAQDLIEFNKLTSDRVNIGKKIKIPRLVIVTIADKNKVDSEYKKITNNTKELYVTYKVQTGDTLQTIARRFNSTVAKLKQINNLKSDKIYVGSKIKIINQFYKK